MMPDHGEHLVVKVDTTALFTSLRRLAILINRAEKIADRLEKILKQDE